LYRCQDEVAAAGHEHGWTDNEKVAGMGLLSWWIEWAAGMGLLSWWIDGAAGMGLLSWWIEGAAGMGLLLSFA